MQEALYAWSIPPFAMLLLVLIVVFAVGILLGILFGVMALILYRVYGRILAFNEICSSPPNSSPDQSIDNRTSLHYVSVPVPTL